MIYADIVLIAVCVLLMFIAYEDYWHLKIRNSSVLGMIGLYLIYLTANSFVGWQSNLAAGIILFLLGVVFWLTKMMGAGDAKLYFPVGLFVGMDGLLIFAIALMVTSLVVAALMMSPVPILLRDNKIMVRLEEIRSGKAVPYGVPIAFSGILVIFMKVMYW